MDHMEIAVSKWVTFRRFGDVWTASAEASKFGPYQRGSESASDLLFAREVGKLLDGDLTRAEERARQVLLSHPQDPEARYLLGASLRKQQRYMEARGVLTDLTRSHPHLGYPWRELGFALQKLGDSEGAIQALLRSIDLNPVETGAWFQLGTLLFADGDSDAHGEDPRMIEARNLHREERFRDAESVVRPLVDAQPENVRALKLLGDILISDRRWSEAQPVFEHCVSLAPDFLPAQFRLASMLLVYNQYGRAHREIEKLLKVDPGNALYRHMEAIVLGGGVQFDRALPLYEQLLSEYPDRSGLWKQYVQLVRFARPDDVVGIYEEILRRFPNHVECYYSIASVKSFRMDASWPDRVLAELEREDLSAESRVQLHFVLGKAFEDLKQYEKSFEHYKASNDLLYDSRQPDGEERTNFKWRSKSVYTRSFFRVRAGTGCQESGPIFILGMPRSGSTLVDQILSSHSAVQGLEELEDLSVIVEKELEKDESGRPRAYPGNVATLDSDRLRSLGELYMTKTRRRRKKSNRPFFTDKSPINFQHVGLIHLILPNAKIIDARRHPLDCCFSCYKHYFPGGQPLATNLRTVGRAYVDYVELMAHFDHVLPGRVHRVIYEKVVESPEKEIRRLLDYIGLPFEEQCLRFHETNRLVRTISAEQVRMPLYKSGVAHWKHYEPWLGPLKEELGCVLDSYPEVPQFFPRLRSQSTAYEFGTINEFDLVKGVRQPPFEIPRQPA
jgi:tetratricopeptide (TPR) repeat protein